MISSVSSPVTNYVSPYCLGMGFDFCPVPSEVNWTPWFFGLGLFLVFLAHPIILMGSDNDLDEPFILNRKVSGLSLILTGSVVTLFGVQSFQFQSGYSCSVAYGCPMSIFSPFYLLTWSQILLGLVLVAIGVYLLKLGQSKKLSEEERSWACERLGASSRLKASRSSGKRRG